MNLIKSEQTTFNGINFRSLLEAKWYYLFLEMGFDLQYEPSLINNKVPDFIIYNYNDFRDLIIEVKPFINKDSETIKKLNDYKKIKRYENMIGLQLYGDIVNYKNAACIGQILFDNEETQNCLLCIGNNGFVLTIETEDEALLTIAKGKIGELQKTENYLSWLCSYDWFKYKFDNSIKRVKGK